MQAPHDTKPRWERRKDARPQELIAAALDLFVERGFASTRLEDVAKRAGVSKGTLYLYFENKEELFKAVVRENIVHVIGQAEDSVAASTDSSVDLLRAMLMEWWRHVGATKLAGITKLMMAESGNFPELTQFYNEEVVTRGNAIITSVLKRGMARGEFRSVDAELMTAILSAPVIMLMMWNNSYLPCDKKDLDSDAYMSAFIELSLRGLVAAPGAP
ncbi:TetR/AcrR family transcriptional regulator [Janthinobacterium sp.]|uniref:TetR/AcrR family transcriptional regulator n=1 Tax=Janthinobacterium sp. TaxID=1871054 RepID=UPI00293D6F50|nr:TetR/AcrR family transcriptional regulator [Janthinobacterium sp.]